MLTSIALAVILAQPRTSISDIVILQQDSARDAVMCGPNALLMFLTLCGTDIDDGAIYRIPYSPAGASLLELGELARTVGVRTEVRHYDPARLAEMPVPAIIQTRTGDGRFHYFVLYKLTSNRASLLDGTTAKAVRVRTSWLIEYWSGYALVRNVVADSIWRGVATTATCANMFAIFYCVRRRQIRLCSSTKDEG